MEEMTRTIDTTTKDNVELSSKLESMESSTKQLTERSEQHDNVLHETAHQLQTTRQELEGMDGDCSAM